MGSSLVFSLVFGMKPFSSEMSRMGLNGSACGRMRGGGDDRWWRCSAVPRSLPHKAFFLRRASHEIHAGTPNISACVCKPTAIFFAGPCLRRAD